MRHFYTVFSTTNGRIDRVFSKSKPGLHPNDVALDESYLDGEFDGADYYVIGGVATPRPPVPPMTEATYDLSELPAGSSLIVTDPLGVETVIESQEDTLELMDVGVWKVRSDAPFPWINFDVEITV